MFSVYDREGVSLAYPQNWRLEEEQSEDASLQLSIMSPGAAFWTLAVYSGLHDLRGLADQALEALREEYPELEQHDAEETVADVSLVGHDVDFIYLDLANSASIRVCHHGESTMLLFSQAEYRESKTAGPVFQAIATSLFSNEPLAPKAIEE